MRILMDFEMNKEAETYKGIRICDIEEFEYICITPTWNPNSRSKSPNELFINLYHHGDTQDTSVAGWYVLDGTEETLNKALNNYNKVIDQLLTTGYAKISDFENTEWM